MRQISRIVVVDALGAARPREHVAVVIEQGERVAVLQGAWPPLLERSCGGNEELGERRGAGAARVLSMRAGFYAVRVHRHVFAPASGHDLDSQVCAVLPAQMRGLDSHPVQSPVEGDIIRSEEHKSELPSLMRNSYAVFCL